MKRTKPPIPEFSLRLERAATRPYALHQRNPAGSKLVRKFYRAKFGVRASRREAAKWYSAYAPVRS